jgi:autophagy-related protein 9
LAFVIGFSTFLIACVDHAHIAHKENLSDVLVPQCLSTLAPFHAITLLLFVGFWLWEALKLALELPQLISTYRTYTYLLDIPGT